MYWVLVLLIVSEFGRNQVVRIQELRIDEEQIEE